MLERMNIDESNYFHETPGGRQKLLYMFAL